MSYRSSSSMVLFGDQPDMLRLRDLRQSETAQQAQRQESSHLSSNLVSAQTRAGAELMPRSRSHTNATEIGTSAAGQLFRLLAWRRLAATVRKKLLGKAISKKPYGVVQNNST